jgi:hypothetical protein
MPCQDDWLARLPTHPFRPSLTLAHGYAPGLQDCKKFFTKALGEEHPLLRWLDEQGECVPCPGDDGAQRLSCPASANTVKELRDLIEWTDQCVVEDGEPFFRDAVKRQLRMTVGASRAIHVACSFRAAAWQRQRRQTQHAPGQMFGRRGRACSSRASPVSRVDALAGQSGPALSGRHRLGNRP